MKKFLALLALVFSLFAAEAKTVRVTNEQEVSLGAGNWLMVTFDVQGEGWFSVWGTLDGEPVLLRDWAESTCELQHITLFVREYPHRLVYEDVFVEVRHKLKHPKH
jgi:hypothetical protein